MREKKNSSFTLGGLLVAPAVTLVLFLPQVASAAVVADHLVISEVFTSAGPGQTNHDFIEIYNPTNSDIDLDSYRLVKRTKSGSADTTLKSWTKSEIVPAKTYYLWANSSYVGTAPDTAMSGTIADNNAVALRLGAADTGTIIDAVAWGENISGLAEGTVFAENIPNGSSLERVTDTDNNNADFIIQSVPTPRNLSSGPETEPQNQPDQQDDTPEEDEEESPPQEDQLIDDDFVPSPRVDPQPEPVVLINEIMPNPLGSDRGAEWIELYNDSDFEVDVSGWFLDDASTFLPSEKAYQLPEGSMIGSKHYRAFLLPSGSITLNNDGDTIRLFNTNRSFLEQAGYRNDGREGESFARFFTYVWEWTDNPTPNGPNLKSVQQAVEDSDTETQSEPNPEDDKFADVKVSFNEIMGNPKGVDSGREWVELINLGDQHVDLTGWYLDDTEEKLSKKYYQFPSGSLVEVEGFITVNLNKEFTITNTGEILSLFSPDKKLRAQVIIPEFPEEDNTFSRRDDNKWDFSLIPTPGEENEFASAPRMIVFSEIFLGESDKQGFIEIHNQEEQWVNLSGWQLARGDIYYLFPKGASVPAQSYMVVPLSQIRFAINLTNLNQLSLLRPDGQIQHGLNELVFPKSMNKTEAVVFENGEVVKTIVPTPYQPNQIANIPLPITEEPVVNTRTLEGRRPEVLAAIEQSRKIESEVMVDENKTVLGESINVQDVPEEDPPIIIERKGGRGFFSKIKSLICSIRIFGVKCN